MPEYVPFYTDLPDELSVLDGIVFGFFVNASRQTGYAFMSVESLAKKLKKSTRTIENSIRNLKKAGLIFRQRRSKGKVAHTYVNAERYKVSSTHHKPPPQDPQYIADQESLDLQKTAGQKALDPQKTSGHLKEKKEVKREEEIIIDIPTGIESQEDQEMGWKEDVAKAEAIAKEKNKTARERKMAKQPFQGSIGKDFDEPTYPEIREHYRSEYQRLLGMPVGISASEASRLKMAVNEYGGTITKNIITYFFANVDKLVEDLGINNIHAGIFYGMYARMLKWKMDRDNWDEKADREWEEAKKNKKPGLTWEGLL